MKASSGIRIRFETDFIIDRIRPRRGARIRPDTCRFSEILIRKKRTTQ